MQDLLSFSRESEFYNDGNWKLMEGYIIQKKILELNSLKI